MICVIVNCWEKQYSCQVGNDYEEIIDLIIEEYIIFKDYISTSLNFVKFLNMKRNDNWPTWIIGHDYECNINRGIDIFIEQKIIYVYIYPGRKIIKIQKVITQQFIEFINRRFLLKHICNKYNVPKDIQNYLIKNFF
jgi:hypothetical protein